MYATGQAAKVAPQKIFNPVMNIVHKSTVIVVVPQSAFNYFVLGIQVYT